MEFVYDIGGGTPVIKEYQVAEAMATVGVPAVIGGAGHGLDLAATTAASDLVGITLSAANAPQTTQNADGSETEELVKVIVNPHAAYRARLSGGTNSNTALTEGTVVTQDTGGDDIDTGVDYSSPSMDEGTIFCVSGTNKGVARKITSLTGQNADVLTPFQLNAGVTIDTDNNNFRVLELDLKEGTNSDAIIVPFDSLWGNGGSI
jgi:hypothetical protein